MTPAPNPPILDDMTATEARALTDARRAESALDYLMRDKVWPMIALVAGEGRDKALIWPLVPGGYNVRGTDDLKDEVAAILREQGFAVKTSADRTFGPMVEVSW